MIRSVACCTAKCFSGVLITEKNALLALQWVIARVGQNRINTPYMTVYFVIPLPKLPYIHRIYIWSWPILVIA